MPYFEGLSSSSDIKDNHSVLNSPNPKPRPNIKCLSDSSLQMKMWGLHSTRIRNEPLSLTHLPENTWTPGGKQPSHTDSKFVVCSTPTTMWTRSRWHPCPTSTSIMRPMSYRPAPRFRPHITTPLAHLRVSSLSRQPATMLPTDSPCRITLTKGI